MFDREGTHLELSQASARHHETPQGVYKSESRYEGLAPKKKAKVNKRGNRDETVQWVPRQAERREEQQGVIQQAERERSEVESSSASNDTQRCQ